MTVPVTADVLLRGQLTFLREHGFDITVISSPGPELQRVAERERVRVIEIAMEREISPVRDAVAWQSLARHLRELAPDIVNASTAKAGLLGMTAAAAARVPVRVYQLRGLRLETEQGVKRTMLAAAERVAALSSSRIICNSHSLRDRYVRDGFAAASKCVVLGAGSSNGVAVERFARARWLDEARELRVRLGIPGDAPVIGFVGRPVMDKGIAELLDAFELVSERIPEARLVLVGAGFAGDAVAPQLVSRLKRERVHLVDRVDEPAPYYVMMDVLAFPSHREGFPNAPLEAGAAGIPTVGSNATGVRDAVVDGETGSLVEIGDSGALADALSRYLLDRDLRERHGAVARRRVVAEYSREVVWGRWRDEYQRLLDEKTAR